MKHELKQPDAFTVAATRAGEWLIKNKKVILFILIGLAVMSMVFVYTTYAKRQKNAKAANDFVKVTKDYPEGLASSDTWKEWLGKLDVFEAKHGASSFVGMTKLYKAKAHFQLKDWDAAKQNFEKAKSNLKHPYTYLAEEGLANTLMEKEDLEGAKTIWKKLSEEKNNPLQAFHLWSLGLVQEALSQKSEAVATYQKFEAQFADSPLLEQVQSRLLDLANTK